MNEISMDIVIQIILIVCSFIFIGLVCFKILPYCINSCRKRDKVEPSFQEDTQDNQDNNDILIANPLQVIIV